MFIECLVQALLKGEKVALEIPDFIFVVPKLDHLLLITNWQKSIHQPELRIVKIPLDKAESIFRAWKRRNGKSKAPLCVTKNMSPGSDFQLDLFVPTAIVTATKAFEAC